MQKAIGDQLFTSQKSGSVSAAYERAKPGELGLRESWFRDAIFSNPELVIGPCRAAGLVLQDEMWYPWAKEFRVDAGPVDVLLVSSRGRLGVIETKLSYNPEKRREVVAQVLDYSLALQDMPLDAFPSLPIADNTPDREDLADCLARGDFLIVVAGDAMDPRALRLAENLFSRHLTSEWALAMIDLNVFESVVTPGTLLIVPEARGVVRAETRQVVRVIVEGATPHAKVVVERLSSIVTSERKQKLGSDEEFLECAGGHCPESRTALAQLVEHFRKIQRASNDRFVFRLQSTSANLYWNCGDKQLRLLALNQHADFQVWLAYVRKAGQDNVVALLCNVASSIVQIQQDDRLGSLHVNADNVKALIAFIDRVVAEVGAIPA